MKLVSFLVFFFFSSRRRHTRYWRVWSSDVCSSDLSPPKRWSPRPPCGRSGAIRSAPCEPAYAGSPYTLALRGEPSPAFAAAEDSLARALGLTEIGRASLGKECRSRWSSAAQQKARE